MWLNISNRRIDMTKVSKKVKSVKSPRRASSPTPSYARWEARSKVMKTLRRTGESAAAGVPVVLHVEHMTVVLDEKIRAAARAASAFVDVGRILRDLCELCLESDRAGRLSSALSGPVRGLGHGMAEVERLLDLAPAPSQDVRSLVSRACLEDQLLRRGSLFYAKYQRSCRNRVNNMVLYARRIRREHGLAAAARSARECLADAGEEAPWFRRAVELVLAAWRVRDPRLVSIMQGVKPEVSGARQR